MRRHTSPTQPAAPHRSSSSDPASPDNVWAREPHDLDDATDSEQPESRGDAATPPDDEHVPRPRPVHFGATRRPVAMTILATLAVAYTLYFARSLLFPITLSCVLFFLLRPMVRWMQRRSVPALLGAALLILGLLLTSAAGIYALAVPAATWLEDVPNNLLQIEDKFRSVFEPLQNIEEASEEVQAIADADEGSEASDEEPGGSGSGDGDEGEDDEEDDEDVQVVEFKQPSLTTTVLDTTGNAAAGAVIVIVLLYLLLALGDVVLNRILHLLPRLRDKRGIVELVRDIEQGISRYLGTITAINICLGVVIGTVMWLIGLPDPLLWGVAAAALNFVPYLGALIGAVAVGISALITFDSVAYAMLAPLSYFIINSIEGNLITPMMLGRSMSLNPVMVFLSVVIWGWMWGIGGVLIAVPVLGIAKIICEHFRKLQPLANLLG